MGKLLIINAHPLVDSKQSVSLQVLSYFLERYRQLNPRSTIEQINLYQDSIPMINRQVLQTWEKVQKEEPLSEQEQQLMAKMGAILQQFKDARKYVIALPVHNFNIPSKLKDYMDNVIIPRETFQYTQTGTTIGLLNEGRKVLVIQASDEIYTNHDWLTEVEFTHKYLKEMFKFMGISDYQIIRAQGNRVRDRKQVLIEAYREADKAVIWMTEK